MSRCQRLDDLYIQSEFFDMSKPDEVRKLLKQGIKTDKKALAMMKKLSERAKETIEKDQLFFKGEDHFIVSYLNIGGLTGNHYKYLIQDINILASNVLGIGETWLGPNASTDYTDQYQLFPPHQGKFF